MKNKLLTRSASILIIISLLMLSGCQINTGIDSLSSANKEVMKISGNISEYEKILADENKNIPEIKEKLLKNITKAEKELEKIEEYKIDEKFEEKYNRTKKRLEQLRLDIEFETR